MGVHYILLACALFGGAFSQSKVEQSEDGSSGSIKFSTPDLNDEESHSPWMPDMLKCDACRVVALQLFGKFEAFNKVHKHFKYNLPESEIIDITEEVCLDRDVFENFGVKNVGGKHRLSGPGLETDKAMNMTYMDNHWTRRYGLKEVNKVHRLTGPGLETSDVPGVMQGGGQWPGRLMDMCEQYMGVAGETEIYNAYKKNPKSRKQFEDFLCRGRGMLGECKKAEEEMAEHSKDEL